MMRIMLIGLATLLLAVSVGLPGAEAVEYRLQVVSLHDEAFFALLGAAGSRREGPVPGRPHLLEALDAGAVPAGAFIYDQPPRAAAAAVAEAFGAAGVRVEVRRDMAPDSSWSEVRWEGKPGDRSVWVIASSRRWYTEARNVALRGVGPLVWAIPHGIAIFQSPAKVLGIPLDFVQAYEGSPALWGRYLSPALDLGDGMAVVVGENSGSVFADHVFIIVKHAPTPTTYKLVLAWERRPHEIQAASRFQETP